MDDFTVENPKLIIYSLKCEDNKRVFEILLENVEILEQARVSLKWLTKEEMLEKDRSVVVKAKQAFVIPRFDDEIFEHLHSLKHLIWGSNVVSFCSAKEKPLPDKPRVLYSMAFKDVTVSFTGLDPEIKEVQGKKIELMGGIVSPEFSMAVDILIAKNCEATPKYRGAFCWKKPICSLKVVDAMWNDGSKHITDRVNETKNDFSMGLLTDCTICVSGVEMDERTIIGQAIEENGGKYVMDMEKGACTHLISDKTSGDKYKFALKWGGVHVVTTRWLRKSLDRKMRLPEEYYHPDPTIRKTVSRPPTEVNQRDFVVPNTERRPAQLPPQHSKLVLSNSIAFTPNRQNNFVANTPLDLNFTNDLEQENTGLEERTVALKIAVEKSVNNENMEVGESVMVKTEPNNESTIGGNFAKIDSMAVEADKTNARVKSELLNGSTLVAQNEKQSNDSNIKKHVVVKAESTTNITFTVPTDQQNKTVDATITKSAIEETENESTFVTANSEQQTAVELQDSTINKTVNLTRTIIAQEINNETIQNSISTVNNSTFNNLTRTIVVQEVNNETVSLNNLFNNSTRTIVSKKVNNSTVTLNQFFNNSTVNNSTVINSTCNETVTLNNLFNNSIAHQNSTIQNSTIQNSTIQNSTIQNSTCNDQAEVTAEITQIAEEESQNESGIAALKKEKEFVGTDFCPNQLTREPELNESAFKTVTFDGFNSTINRSVDDETAKVNETSSTLNNDAIQDYQPEIDVAEEFVVENEQPQDEANNTIVLDDSEVKEEQETIAQSFILKNPTIDPNIAHSDNDSIEPGMDEMDVAANEEVIAEDEDDLPASDPLFSRMSHAPASYLSGDNNAPRRLRLRINTANWSSALLDLTASSHNEQDDSQVDETLDPSLIAGAFKKAAQKNEIQAPLSTLNESQVPDEVRHCYRKSAFQPPQFSPMSGIDEDEFAGKENQAQ